MDTCNECDGLGVTDECYNCLDRKEQRDDEHDAANNDEGPD